MAKNPFPGNSGIKLVGQSTPKGGGKPAPKKAPAQTTQSGQFTVGLGEGPYPNTGFVASVPYTHGLHDLPLAGSKAPAKKTVAQAVVHALKPTQEKPVSNRGGGIDPGFQASPSAAQIAGRGLKPAANIDPGFNGGEAVVIDKRTGQISYRPLNPTQKGSPGAGTAPAGQTIAQQVAALVNSIINPQLSALTTDENQRRAVYQAAAQELINSTKNAPGQIANDYNQAIQAQTQLGAAGAAALQGANPNADVQKLLDAAGAPDSQKAQIASNLNNVYGLGGGVIAGTQGTLPASALEAHKAAALAFAHTLPTVAAMTGTQDLDVLAKAFSDARAKVLEQRGQLTLNARGQIIDQQQKADYNKQLALYRQQQFGETVNQHKVQNAQTQQRLDIATEQAIANLYGTDSKGNLTLSGRKVAAAELKAQKKAAGMTPGQYSALTAKAQKMADTLYYGVPPVTRKDGTVIKPGRSALDYQGALKRLQTSFKGLRLYDAQQILDTYWKPGEDGRPYLTYQVRMALLNSGADAKLVDRAAHNPYIAEKLLKEYGVASG